MKSLITVLLSLFLGSAFAQFEGTIEVTTIGENGTVNQTWSISPNALKISFVNPTEKGELKIDLIAISGSSELIIITDGAGYNGYYNAPLASINGRFGFEKINFSKGNKSEKGLKFQGANKQLQCAVWMNDLDIDLSKFSQFFKGEPAFFIANKFNQKGIPNTTLVTNHNGELLYSFTSTNIVEKKLDASTFEIPQGLEEIPLTEK